MSAPDYHQYGVDRPCNRCLLHAAVDAAITHGDVVAIVPGSSGVSLYVAGRRRSIYSSVPEGCAC